MSHGIIWYNIEVGGFCGSLAGIGTYSLRVGDDDISFTVYPCSGAWGVNWHASKDYIHGIKSVSIHKEGGIARLEEIAGSTPLRIEYL